ncbi:hypothetical protein [Ruminococcus sp.]|uniref:hypothetical protein n=1 Tax=Ruminococcus sp. TaxID=41978 RepID=UPI0025E222B1|nr:hypothetical protein [Ruminococcus sp.]MBQ8966921.1 hypothetical protein [Ruminococcus sp.]
MNSDNSKNEKRTEEEMSAEELGKVGGTLEMPEYFVINGVKMPPDVVMANVEQVRKNLGNNVAEFFLVELLGSYYSSKSLLLSLYRASRGELFSDM